MAKRSEATQEHVDDQEQRNTTEVVEHRDQLPANYQDQYAGEGTYTEDQYTITPRVSILQALSPQCKRTNAAYIDGATPGQILLMNYHQPLHDGQAGIVFQPCWFNTEWEVRTDRAATGAANYVSAHPRPLPGWTQHRAERGNFVFYTTPEGHIANEVHVHAGLVHIDNNLLPYAIRFSGTGVFISKNFNGMIGGRRTATGKPAARFGFTYTMRVKTQSNQQGEWGQWNIAAKGEATPEQMKTAHDFRMALEERRAIIDRGGEDEMQEVQGADAPM